MKIPPFFSFIDLSFIYDKAIIYKQHLFKRSVHFSFLISPGIEKNGITVAMKIWDEVFFLPIQRSKEKCGGGVPAKRNRINKSIKVVEERFWRPREVKGNEIKRKPFPTNCNTPRMVGRSLRTSWIKKQYDEFTWGFYTSALISARTSFFWKSLRVKKIEKNKRMGRKNGHIRGIINRSYLSVAGHLEFPGQSKVIHLTAMPWLNQFQYRILGQGILHPVHIDMDFI